MIRRSFIGLGTAVALLGTACEDGKSGTNDAGHHEADAQVHDDAGQTDSGADDFDASAGSDAGGDGDVGHHDAGGDSGAENDPDAGMDAATGADADAGADAGTDDHDAHTGDAGADASVALPALAAHYAFDENTGTSAADSADNFDDATLVGGASWTTGHDGSALALAGGPGKDQSNAPLPGNYAALPATVLDGCDDITIALWMKLGSVDNWARLLDVDGTQNGFLFFTPAQDVGAAMPNLYFDVYYPQLPVGSQDQGVSAPYPAGTVLVGQWHHVAFTYSAGTGRLYFDGAQIGSNPMSVKPSDLTYGAAAHAWIGKSMFNDTYLNAAIDDLRVSCTAYTAEQIAELAR
jgi:hypothetical protein